MLQTFQRGEIIGRFEPGRRPVPVREMHGLKPVCKTLLNQIVFHAPVPTAFRHFAGRVVRRVKLQIGNAQLFKNGIPIGGQLQQLLPLIKQVQVPFADRHPGVSRRRGQNHLFLHQTYLHHHGCKALVGVHLKQPDLPRVQRDRTGHPGDSPRAWD